MDKKIEDAYSFQRSASTVEEELWKEPNLKFIVKDKVRVCECCELSLKQYPNDERKYVKDLTREDLNCKIITIYSEGNFNTILLAKEIDIGGLCERCKYECCSPNDEKEEGPYGGAFKDMDDYYTWKNGKII